MNDTLSHFARQTLKKGLATCTSGQQDIFKRMYSFSNRSLPIDEVVDQMPEGKLDWAMQQVEGTCRKNSKREQEEKSDADSA